MNLISESEGFLIFGLFGVFMFVVAYFLSRKKGHEKDRFLVADRNVSWFRGALSIAVSWIWAPAIFIVSLQAYTQGIAGAFWFIVPNILCFFVFAPVAIKLRELMPNGYTLPEFIDKRFEGDKKTHLIFLLVFFGYQLGAIVINALAGGTLLHVLTGMDFHTAVIGMSLIALVYSLISGLEASILTDVFQMLMILIVCIVLVPWLISDAGGLSAVFAAFGGESGDFGNIFDPVVAYSFGIAMTFGLIAGPIGDQMFFQRSFAVKKKDIVKTFVVGGLLFGLVPIMLSSLGFIAANPEFSTLINVTDPQMVGPLTIAYFLPKAALLLFVVMAFAGLCSTLDSAFCAISSLGSIDIFKRYTDKDASDKDVLSVARKMMILMAVIGTGIALMQPKLLWLFLINGALASAGFFPTILSIFWKGMTKNAAFYGIILSLVIGLPMSIYANVTENTDLIVLSSVLSVVIGLVVSLGVSMWESRFEEV